SPRSWKAKAARHERRRRYARPGADPVRALVPDPGRAVLAVPAPAAHPGAALVRCRLAAARAGGLPRQPALELRLRRPQLRPPVAADPRHLGGLRRVPGGDDGGVLPAPQVAGGLTQVPRGERLLWERLQPRNPVEKLAAEAAPTRQGGGVSPSRSTPGRAPGISSSPRRSAARSALPSPTSA